ncbi:rab gtpase, putative [Ichthyophthirius multifiliis]|uniref:Rab gtpase, putative n=1 Tax=Ichthyophthirius multifiliis TaxID=5932 RepID=G0QUN1_ICHMU|nr:rab gtpase, putative [Ichthyophthirius multifiliis]EGR31077.1 rab gtpase, putative [Ichthyophthirius multifiliis]|eukprot:XP_004034563.1 rab gtpase, putative [Ichthyophthirius multifiliis]
MPSLVGKLFKRQWLQIKDSNLLLKDSLKEINKISILAKLYEIDDLQCEGYIIKIILAGDEFVGKTSILKQFKYKTFCESYCKTTGYEFQSKEIIRNKQQNQTITLQIWDTLYNNCSAVILVYDKNINRKDQIILQIK